MTPESGRILPYVKTPLSHTAFHRLLEIALLLAFSGLPASADDFFEQRIRPVLIARCFECHSAQADPLKSEFRLDSAAGLAKGGKSGLPAIISGDPERSRLIEAIRRQNPKFQMPPKDPLSPQVVADFEQWIAEGAAYPESAAPVDLMATAKQHWAFHAPQPQALPTVSNTAWPKTEIDYFILSALDANGLAPSPEADRRTLIRRLSFDLLGLPPTPGDVSAFVSDSDPDAYAKLVDRYLASPHYGERWARHWLDVARYADTKGYVYGDREEVKFTHSHVYRDWVIGAMNRDLPYDQFIRLQLAADKLTDDSTRGDLAAMGFLTLGQRFLGVMPDIIDDRIDTVTRGLMGLTVSCARCHDHKFDPIPTQDYYSLYGVFSASSERTVPLAPSDLDDPRYAPFADEMRKRETAVRDRFAAKTVELEERLRNQVDRYLEAVPIADSLPTDDFYEIRNAEDLNPTIVRRWANFIGGRGPEDPIFGLWNRFAALPEDPTGASAAALLAPILAIYSSAILPVTAATQTATVLPQTNLALERQIHRSPPSSFADLARIYGGVFKSVVDEWHAALKAAADTKSDPPACLPDPAREAIRAMLMADGAPGRVPGGAIVDLEWMFDEPSRVELTKLHAELDRWILGAETAPDYTMMLVDKPELTPARIFLRGNPATPGTEVPRQFLALLSRESRHPFAEGSGRRELAEAVASEDNPLTARVFVNRVWGWHFGAGLVATPSDFGTRAAAPSHPELLDWLARFFVDSGWSLKELHRQIVLSATYRQASASAEDDVRVQHALQADPEDRLLWRFNRHRLDFESLRDALLFASGELDPALGGRPVELTAAPYPTRRTLYGRVDRQFLPPVFRVFDFPNPDMHAPQRIGTTVPQQALYLMNNPFVQQQARALAARAESACTAAPERVEWLYQHAYQRAATPEQTVMSLVFAQHAEATAPPPPPKVDPPQWSYGYAKLDAATGALSDFTPLPHFTGAAWQGGSAWPDGALGWAQLTAEGGHPGNDLDHAVVRRWTSPVAGRVQIEGRIRHERTEGDGVMARVASSRHGLLGSWSLHNTESDANFYGIAVEPGDTIDFEVDIKKELNHDQFLWTPIVTLMDKPVDVARATWDAHAEFAGPYIEPPNPLSAWAKLAQVLLSSNEFMYVD